MSLVFRTAGAWGPGEGINLTPVQIDGNFWDHEERIVELETNPPTANGIAAIEANGLAWTVILNDSTEIGPIPIPVPFPHWRNAWAPATLYAVLDQFSVAGQGIFMVMVGHVSAGSFDPDAVGAAQAAGSFSTGANYVIATVGTTDFTLIGAASNTIGVEFTATGAGTGTGTATPKVYQQLVGITANSITLGTTPIALGDDVDTIEGLTLGAASVWNGDVVAGQYGGTGVANTGKTITLGGNLSTIGAFATILRSSAATDITLPTTGTLATLAGAETLTNKSLTSPILTTPALGTPASGVMTNVTGLPIGSGVSGLGTGIATLLATPSSANLLAALTTKTGTGLNVFDTSPTIASPTFSGTITTPFTAGSIPFIGASGVLTQDNAALFWNAATNSLTIGNGTGASNAFVSGLDTATTLTSFGIFAGVQNLNATNNNYASFAFRGANTSGSVQTNAVIAGVFTDHTVGAQSADMAFITRYAGTLAERMRLIKFDLRQGTGTAIATTSADGFLLIASCAGTPTGAPTNAATGAIPMIYDTAADKIWFYRGGTWRGVVVA